MEIKGKRFAVLGLSYVGMNIARALAKGGAQVTGFGFEGPEENAKIAAEMAKLKGKAVFEDIPVDALSDFDAVILTPFGGMYLEAFERAKERGVPVFNDLDFAYTFMKGKVIAVTGTCGKSTTVGLIEPMLKAQGFKVLSLGGANLDWGAVVNDRAKYDYYLLEVGSSRLEYAEKFRPDIAVLLNIFPAHGERHGGNLVKYTEAKARIFAHQGPEDWLVYDAGAENLQELVRQKQARAKPVKFSLKSGVVPPGVYHDRGAMHWTDAEGRGASFSLKNSRINTYPTRILDAMAAVAVAELCGVEAKHIQKALDAFKPLPGRLKKIRKLDGVAFVDDSQSNNIGSTIWALNSFSHPILWIAGGEMVFGSKLNVIPRYVKGKIKRCILVGTLTREIGELFKDWVPVVEAFDLSKAVEIANQVAESGDVVLFSPACPPDPTDPNAGPRRSEIFRQKVKDLPRTPRMMRDGRAAFTRI